MNATAEANRKAEYVTSFKEERAKRTTPEEIWSHTAPGSGHAAMMEQATGVPYAGHRGIPISSMPSPEAAYEQYRNEMGISAQAPQIPDVTAPAVPTPPSGASKAREYVDALLRRRGIQTPVLGGY
jgi:hypothetical protein